MEIVEIIVLRHGQADGDCLTEKGRKQAAEAAAKIEDRVSAICCSPRQRAIQTAQIISYESAGEASLVIIPELDYPVRDGEAAAEAVCRLGGVGVVVVITHLPHLRDGRGVTHSLARRFGLYLSTPLNQEIGGGRGFRIADGAILPFPR